jgi:hypothetical protein
MPLGCHGERQVGVRVRLLRLAVTTQVLLCGPPNGLNPAGLGTLAGRAETTSTPSGRAAEEVRDHAKEGTMASDRR